MRLVTITGADDAVDPQALDSLSCEFPFVEWGILFSARRHGTPRYPSLGWVLKFVRIVETRISAHLCGEYARAYPKRLLSLPPHIGAFDRIQVNGYAADGVIGRQATERLRPTIILQCRAESDLQQCAHDADIVGGHVLFDPSGGRGIEPFSWPRAPLGCTLGYAGGITPDNVRDVLRDIGPCGPNAWIDMESGVRTGDAFDLAKVRAVLEAVAASGWVT